MSEQSILSQRATPPTDMFEAWNRLSTVTQRIIQKLSHLGLNYKLQFLQCEEDIAQYHAFNKLPSNNCSLSTNLNPG